MVTPRQVLIIVSAIWSEAGFPLIKRMTNDYNHYHVIPTQAGSQKGLLVAETTIMATL